MTVRATDFNSFACMSGSGVTGPYSFEKLSQFFPPRLLRFTSPRAEHRGPESPRPHQLPLSLFSVAAALAGVTRCGAAVLIFSLLVVSDVETSCAHWPFVNVWRNVKSGPLPIFLN